MQSDFAQILGRAGINPVRACQARPTGLSKPLQACLHCSQGGVKFPTGGKGSNAKPASAPEVWEVSRSGVNPEPTVIVRMKENGTKRLCRRAWLFGRAIFGMSPPVTLRKLVTERTTDEPDFLDFQ